MDKTNNIITTDITEKELHPVSGMLMLIINIVGILFSMLLCVISPLMFYGAAGGLGVVIGVLLLVLFCIMFAGLKVVNPNEALVLTLFGKYHGTIKSAGFFFVNPFCTAFNPTAGALQEETSQDLGEALKKGKTVKASSKTRGRKVSTKTMTLNNAQQMWMVIRSSSVRWSSGRWRIRPRLCSMWRITSNIFRLSVILLSEIQQGCTRMIR